MTKSRNPSGGGVNWLTQEEIDCQQRELDDSKIRDEVYLKIAIGMVLIYAGYVLYDVVRRWLP